MPVRYGQSKRLKGFGVGTIIPWSGDVATIPTGWLACTGGTRQVSDYSMLYDVIGNTYGGTVGSTFGLPQLISGRAISDTYEGHYSYLKTKNASHLDAVITSSISSDPFWRQISNDINTQNNLGGESVIDVVGRFINPANKPNVVATVRDIEFSQGEYTLLYGIHPRKLSERHQSQTAHAHGIETPDGVDANSYTTGGSRASSCARGVDSRGCIAPNTGCHTPTSPGQRYVLNNPGSCLVRGGSSPNSSETSMINDGDGVITGNMYAAAIGYSGRNLATSMSNSSSTTWNTIASHQHVHPGATFKCNVGIQSAYTYYDINSSAVILKTDAGVNAASININTATPSLTMVYIIKAY